MGALSSISDMDSKKVSTALVFALALVACIAVFSFHEPAENVKSDLFTGLSGGSSAAPESHSESDFDFEFSDDSKGSEDFDQFSLSSSEKQGASSASSLFSALEPSENQEEEKPQKDALAADEEKLHPSVFSADDASDESSDTTSDDNSAASDDTSTAPDTSYLDSLFSDKSSTDAASDDAATSNDAATSSGDLQDGDNVQVQYKLRLADNGKEVYKQWGEGDGGTFDFQLGGGHVIPGFDSAVSEMKVGQEKTVTIPASEAYGSKGFSAMGIPPDADLEYTLKVVGSN